MKQLTLFLLLLLAATAAAAQTPAAASPDSMYRVIKTDGTFLYGKVLRQDARELLLRTEDGREIFIPQHVIQRLEPSNQKAKGVRGEYVGEDRFATRYFITTNGLPIKKGEHYVQWNLFGPDFQFALGNDVGVGVMTTWLGTPIVGSIKKSFQLGEKAHFALGSLVGTGSWIAPDWGGALPYGTFSVGDRQKNIAFSGGYGFIWQNGELQERALWSVAGIYKVSPRFSLIFDSFIMPAMPSKTSTFVYQAYVQDPVTGDWRYEDRTGTRITNRPAFALLIPGVRWHQAEGQAIQFGFSGALFDGRSIPIPMVVWYRSLN